MIADYGFIGLVLVAVFALALLAIAAFAPVPTTAISAPSAWRQRRFGFTVYALIFLAFDMEMIFMYPWAVVFTEIGWSAFLDMLVFIAILSSGIAYAWTTGGLDWE